MLFVMAFRSLSCIFFLLPVAVAYRETVPVVAWSSHHSPKLDAFASRPEQFTRHSQLFDVLVKESELCNFEAIIIADQPGLHASDLRAFRKDSHLHNQLTQTKSSLQIPYLPFSNDDDSFEILKASIAERCGARRVELELGQGGIVFHEGEKHVIAVAMPSLEEESNPFGRERALAECDKRLHKDIANVASVFPSHIVVYTSSRPLKKRQAAAQDPETPMDVSRPTIDNAVAPPNTTSIKGSLTQRYRFFTPGLITALLIVFGILVPLLMFGIYALASIQSPVRMDTPKGSSLEKKNQ